MHKKKRVTAVKKKLADKRGRSPPQLCNCTESRQRSTKIMMSLLTGLVWLSTYVPHKKFCRKDIDMADAEISQEGIL